MALETFAPPIGPSPGTAHKPQIKIREAEFGDGYSQPTPDGINHIRRTVSLKWDGLTYAQMKAINDFFVQQKGTIPFYYKPFGEEAPVKWTCQEWTRNTDDGVWKVTAALVESFGAER